MGSTDVQQIMDRLERFEKSLQDHSDKSAETNSKLIEKIDAFDKNRVSFQATMTSEVANIKETTADIREQQTDLLTEVAGHSATLTSLRNQTADQWKDIRELQKGSGIPTVPQPNDNVKWLVGGGVFLVVLAMVAVGSLTVQEASQVVHGMP